jgi:hypothetical protein
MDNYDMIAYVLVFGFAVGVPVWLVLASLLKK